MSIIHASGLAVLAGLSSFSVPAHAADTVTAWRLFIADHAAPTVTALDLASGEVLDSFGIDAPASLYLSSSGEGVYAVQGDADRVAGIATGITVADHGDHGDLEVSAPKLLGPVVAGDNPVHFVEHDGHIVIFFDNEGVARIAHEHDWLAGDLHTHEYRASGPHHGVAARIGDAVIISEPKAGDASALPVGIRVIDHDGNRVGDLHACPDLHGEASSGDTLALACASGLLLVKEGREGPEITHLAYAGLPEGKVTTLIGGVGMQYWLGNYGADRVVIIDPSAAAAFRLVNLPTRRVHFAVDPADARHAYVFTEDGKLQRLDVISGEITGTLAVTAPYSMDGAWNLPRPRIAVGGGVVAVTDPGEGAVHLVDTASFTLARTIALGGAPFAIVAVGGSGASHG